MATKKKAVELSAQDLLDKYMDFVLAEERKPSSVFKFCKEHGIEEAEFYKHFSSLEMLESSFFTALHQHTLTLLHKNEEYHTYNDANKLLSYYFTFFEMATANRSYILFSLKASSNPLESILQLKDLRKHFLAFTDEILKDRGMVAEEKLQKIQGKLIQEGAWAQFLFAFRFWMQDTSPNFEKTDIMIEKSVKASFDVLDNFPMKSVIDFGKFLWKERPFQ